MLLSSFFPSWESDRCSTMLLNNVVSNAIIVSNEPKLSHLLLLLLCVYSRDSGFILLEDGEFSKLKQEGRVTLAYPKTLNGKFTDLTQKPIPVLKE